MNLSCGCPYIHCFHRKAMDSDRLCVKTKPSCTHRDVKCGVDTESSLFGRKGFASPQDVVAVPRARFLLADETDSLLAAQSCVVGLTHSQEVRGQIPCHHLTRIHKDICGKEAECIHTCRQWKKLQIWWMAKQWIYNCKSIMKQWWITNYRKKV